MTSQPTTADKRFLIMAASFNFIVLGVGQSLLGPSFRALEAAFSIPATTVSVSVSVLFLGATIGILCSGLALRRFGYRKVMVGSHLLLAAGGALIGFAPAWWLLLAGTFLAGLGFGTQNVTTNLIAVRVFAGRSAPVVNFISALFGLGSVLGPLLVGVLLPAWRVPFLLLAGAAFLASFPNMRVHQPEAEVPLPGGRSPAILASLAGFVVLFLLYVSVEVGASSWAATHLAPHYGDERAAFLTSLFWLALTAGRFVAIPVSARMRPPHLVLASVLLALVGAVMAHSPALAPYGYMLMGFGFAPVFPTALVWVQQALPGRTEAFLPLVMAAANLGPVVSAPVIGWSVTRLGSGFVPTALTIIGVALLAVVLVQMVRTRQA